MTIESLPPIRSAAGPAEFKSVPPASAGRRGWLPVMILIAWGVRLATLPEQALARLTVPGRIVLFLPLLASIPVVSRGVLSFASRIHLPARRNRLWVALTFALVGTAWLYCSAVQSGKRFVPLVKDEYSYLLGARMLTAGRLWMPKHPLADFFVSTSVLTSPVYASDLTPGTAMLHAPGVAMRLPPWVTCAALVFATITLLYLVIAKLSDDLLASGACLLFISSAALQWSWRFVLAQGPAALFGLLLVGAFLQWRGSGRQLRWAFAMGAIAGWAVLIRPVEGLTFALPIGVGMLIDARHYRSAVWRSVLAGLATAVPFIVVQLLLNFTVTGRVSQYPMAFYHERFLAGINYGAENRPPANAELPPDAPPQRKAELATEVRAIRKINQQRRHDFLNIWHQRLPAFLDGSFPHPWLAVFLPLGLLTMGRRGTWVLILSLPVWFLLYLPWPYVLGHYPVTIAPASIFLVVAGMRELSHYSGRWAGTVTAFAVLSVFSASLAAQPFFTASTQFIDPEVISPWDIDAAVRKVTNQPAVVLLRYDSPYGPKMRSYNLDVSWPDDAPIIKALDLGPRNGEIARYYAERQPHRQFFQFDFATAQLTPLGNAAEFAVAPAAVEPPQPTTSPTR